VYIAGKTVWSMPERFRVVCIPYKALYKCSDLPFYLYLISVSLSLSLSFCCDGFIRVCVVELGWARFNVPPNTL